MSDGNVPTKTYAGNNQLPKFDLYIDFGQLTEMAQGQVRAKYPQMRDVEVRLWRCAPGVGWIWEHKK